MDRMKVKLDWGAYEPVRAHETDAGIDLRSPESTIVRAKNSAVIPTGVHVQLPKGTCGLLVSKSGLNVKNGITSTGLIDEGYTGQIIVRLENNSDKDYMIWMGDKISQLVILPCLYETVEIVSELDESERGDNGFGSTGL